MARMILPQANRPSTALPGVSDLRDENVYSACVFAHGGVGTAKIFTVPQGQAIPTLKGSVTPTANRHLVYTLLTTNLEKAGELGNNLGDAGIRAIGVTLETAAPVVAVGPAAGFVTAQSGGFGAPEVADILGKTYFELKVSNKRQIVGPLWAFPNMGGIGGSVAIASNITAGAQIGFMPSTAQNGQMPVGRKLRVPVMVARNDVLVCEITAADAYAFSVTTGTGTAGLCWVNLISTVKGDAR